MDGDVYKTRRTLLERLHDRNDDSSWKEFVETYRGYIFVVIRRMGIDEASTEDLVQQVLVKLWDKLPEFSYDSKKRFRSYVATVTRNKVNDFVRSIKAEQKRINKTYSDESLKIIEVPEVEVIAQQEWELFIANRALQNIRDSFSGNAIEVFERMLDGENPEEIAQSLNIKKNSVHQLNKRVKEKMIEEIKRLKFELE